MSIRVNVTQTVDVALAGAYLAAVVDGGDVMIWPAGPGEGPSITMSRRDWTRISREVRLAYMRADGVAP